LFKEIENFVQTIIFGKFEINPQLKENGENDEETRISHA